MEAVFGALAIFLVGASVAGLIVALLALTKLGDLRRRVERLEREALELHRARAPAPEPPAPRPESHASRPEPPASRPEPHAPRAEAPPPSPVPGQAPRPAPLPRPEPPPPRPLPARARTDWERWLGVRGAAVVGGILLAISGFLFFKYSIEHGLITREMRVALGVLVGLGCMIGARPLRKRGYPFTADALTSGGAVVLYAAFWAAHALFGMFAFGVSFALMALVTAACCLIALRDGSQLVAGLGLAGGFATPLALGSQHDRPVGLFGYVLILNLGFLFAARKQRWPAIGAVGLLGTLAIETLWTWQRLKPENFAIALVVLGVFGLLFVVFASAQPAAERRRWMLTEAGSLLVPFAFAAYFAQRADLGYHLWPLVALSILLAVAAGWMSRTQEVSWIPAATSVGSLAVVLTWIVSEQPGETARVWELVVCVTLLALAYHAFRERRPADSPRRNEIELGDSLAAALAACGGFASLILGAAREVEAGLWPALAGAVALALLLHRQGALDGRIAQPALAGAGAGLVWLMWTAENARSLLPDDPAASGHFPAPVLYLALLLATAALLLALARGSHKEAARAGGWFGAAAFAVLGLLALLREPGQLAGSSELVLAAMLLLGLALAVAATGARSGVLFAVAVVLTALSQSTRIEDGPRELVLGWFSVLAFCLWPLATRDAWSASRWTWPAAALAPLLWFPALLDAFQDLHGEGLIGLVPLVLAVAPVVAALRLRGEASGSPGDTGRVWYAAVAVILLAIVLPRQIDEQWQAVSLALAGAGLVQLWNRLPRRGLEWVGAAALVLATLLLFLEPFDASLERYGRSVINVRAWVYLAPAAAAVVAARAAVARAWRPGAAACGLAAVLLVFVWMNLEVLNAFETGERFRIRLERLPARDMALSIAWAVYALALLLLGVRLRSAVLRWASLALLLLTLGKVFLLDLGNLQGLHRVASFLGLAMSLLLVSWLYQRLVFRDRAGSPVPDEAA